MAAEPATGLDYRRLRRGPPVAVGGLVVTPVVLEERAAGMSPGGPWAVAAKRPVAVIVAWPGGRRLVRLDKIDATPRTDFQDHVNV